MSRKARQVLVVCIAVIVAVACAAMAVIQTLHLREMKQQLDSITEQLAQQKQKLEETQRQLEAERAARAEEEAYALSRSDQLARAAQARADIADGDEIGRVWVEDTQLNCPLYWGDTGSQFRNGAGAHAADGCVLPGENGTVFVGGHTDSWFEDLKSAQVGGIIHLETPWGTFSYKITETKVIEETRSTSAAGAIPPPAASCTPATPSASRPAPPSGIWSMPTRLRPTRTA